MSKRPVDVFQWGRDGREKVLLSIIDAYPMAGENRQVRLDQAKKALFGEGPTSRTKKKAEDDGWFLMAMAYCYVQDRHRVYCKIDKKWKKDPNKRAPRSISKLAREAGERAPATWGKSAEERLRKKFEANIKALVAAERHGDDVGRALDYKTLKMIKALLAQLDVSMEIEYAARSLDPATKLLDNKKMEPMRLQSNQKVLWASKFTRGHRWHFPRGSGRVVTFRWWMLCHPSLYR